MHVPQIQQPATGSELYTVYLDGLAQTTTYATKAEADLVAVNLKLANPNAVVTHSSGQTTTTNLTYLPDPAPEPAPEPTPTPTPAPAVLFFDDFASGVRSAPQNGITYGPAQVNVTVVPGNMLLRHPPKETGFDSSAEQRIMLNRQLLDFWIAYDLTIPANYFHRTEPLGANNNKFIAIYASPYNNAPNPPDFQVNFSTYPSRDGTGESTLKFHSFNLGRENPPRDIPGTFITLADKGRTMRIVIHINVDGTVQLWKDGTLFDNASGLAINGGAKHYMDELYLMGWSNSGFTEETVFQLANLKINDSVLV